MMRLLRLRCLSLPTFLMTFFDFFDPMALERVVKGEAVGTIVS